MQNTRMSPAYNTKIRRIAVRIEENKSDATFSPDFKPKLNILGPVSSILYNNCIALIF